MPISQDKSRLDISLTQLPKIISRFVVIFHCIQDRLVLYFLHEKAMPYQKNESKGTGGPDDAVGGFPQDSMSKTAGVVENKVACLPLVHGTQKKFFQHGVGNMRFFRPFLTGENYHLEDSSTVI